MLGFSDLVRRPFVRSYTIDTFLMVGIVLFIGFYGTSARASPLDYAKKKPPIVKSPAMVAASQGVSSKAGVANPTPLNKSAKTGSRKPEGLPSLDGSSSSESGVTVGATHIEAPDRHETDRTRAAQGDVNGSNGVIIGVARVVMLAGVVGTSALVSAVIAPQLSPMMVVMLGTVCGLTLHAALRPVTEPILARLGQWAFQQTAFKKTAAGVDATVGHIDPRIAADLDDIYTSSSRAFPSTQAWARNIVELYLQSVQPLAIKAKEAFSASDLKGGAEHIAHAIMHQIDHFPELQGFPTPVSRLAALSGVQNHSSETLADLGDLIKQHAQSVKGDVNKESDVDSTKTDQEYWRLFEMSVDNWLNAQIVATAK